MAKFQKRKFMRKQKQGNSGAVVLPPTYPAKNKDSRFKQVNRYRIKPEPFPRVLYTRAKYGDFGTLTAPTAGVAVATVYRLNSIYDPFFSVGGRTCVGWQALSGLYRRYLVLGAKITVSFNNPSADGQRVGIRLRIAGGNTAVGNSMQDITEKEMTYVKGLNDTGSQKCGFSLFVRPWTLMGISKLEYMANSSAYTSLMNGNPAADSCFADIFLINPVTGGTTVNYMTRIVYYVQCYDRLGQTSNAF